MIALSLSLTCISRIRKSAAIILGLFVLSACESKADICDCVDDCLDQSKIIADWLHSGEMNAAEVADRYSQSPEILRGIGQSLWHPRMSRNALVILEKAETACRHNPVFLNHLAEAYWDNFRFEDAIEIFQRLVDSRMVPQGDANDLLVAQYRVMTGQHQLAVELLDGILDREAEMLGKDISVAGQIGALEEDILLWRGVAECLSGRTIKSLDSDWASEVYSEFSRAIEGICLLHEKALRDGPPVDDVRSYFASCRPLLSLDMIENVEEIWKKVGEQSLVCEQERGSEVSEYLLELENQSKLVLAALLAAEVKGLQ